MVSRREGTRIYYRAADVRGLLDEAALVARASATEETGTAAEAAAPEQTVAAPATRARAVRRRPATGH